MGDSQAMHSALRQLITGWASRCSRTGVEIRLADSSKRCKATVYKVRACAYSVFGTLMGLNLWNFDFESTWGSAGIMCAGWVRGGCLVSSAPDCILMYSSQRPQYPAYKLCICLRLVELATCWILPSLSPAKKLLCVAAEFTSAIHVLPRD